MNKFYLSFLCFITSITFVYAQNSQKITGTVKDQDGLPIPGVSVKNLENNRHASTNNEGFYELIVNTTDTKLQFSYIGTKTVITTSDGRKNIDIVLEMEENMLEDLIIIGYGTAKKKDLTGAIAHVNGEDLANRNVTQVSQALQGTMPGVMVTRTSGEAGATANINVRGVTSIGDSSPLIIVDGVPVPNINDINAKDIADITVLKDAASASIYGARAAAGVILVTTKRAKKGEVSLEYSNNFGFVSPTAFPETVGVTRYLEMINEHAWNDAGNAAGGDYALYTKDDVENWLTYNQTNPNDYPVTDWNKLLLKGHALNQNHSIGITAGGEKMRTRASISYDDQGEIYDHKSFKRVLTRVNNSIDITPFLTADIDLSYNYTDNTNPNVNPIWEAIRFAPIYASHWADGRIADGKTGSNAYAKLQYGGFDDYNLNKFNSRLALNFKPIKDLKITAVFSPNLYHNKYKKFVKQIPYYDAENPDQLAGYMSGFTTTNLTEKRNDGASITKQLFANYTKDFKGHSLNALIGYEDFYTKDEVLNAFGNNFELDNFPYLDLAPVDYSSNGGDAYETAYRSYFGRIMYDYKDKYYLQANIRYDGSSRFHPDYRWGAFPSISAGWAVSEENFMKDVPLISYLKLRGSWGQLGNERIGNYPYQSSINFSNTLFYQGSQVVSGTTAAQVNYAIPDITWEVTETFDIGLDVHFLDNRLIVNADYYKKNTKRMLLELEIPDYIGFENPQQNTGKMHTKGWDLGVTWKSNINDFRYSVGLNISDSRSVMGDLGGIVFDGPQITRLGSEYNEWYGYVSEGLYQTADDVKNSAVLSSAVKPGDIKYKDVSGPNGVPDGIISPDYDRVLLGGSLPRYIYGGIVNMQYKGFDLSLAFQGVGKQNSYLSSEMMRPFQSAWTSPSAVIDGQYWSQYQTPEHNLQAKYPRLSYIGAENNNYETSDYWLIDGSYFRLKNIMLGYTIPGFITKKAKLKDVRIYASASDLFSVNNFPKGWDPETDYNSYISKTFNFGISVKF